MLNIPRCSEVLKLRTRFLDKRRLRASQLFVIFSRSFYLMGVVVSADDVCRLPTTGGSAFVLFAGLFLLVFGVIVARWARQSSGRLSIVVAPLVLLGGLALTPSVIDPCVSPPITTTVPSASSTVPSASSTVPSATTTIPSATTTVPSATTTTTTTPQYELLENTIWGTGSEGDSIQEFAPEGKIFTEVLFASYGTPTGADGQFQQGACHAENSYQIVADEFIGNSEGNLTFDNSTFGNPCGDTAKTFAIVLAYEDDPTPTTTTTTEVPTTTTTTDVPSGTTTVPSVTTTTTTTTTTTSTTTTTLAPVALYAVGDIGPSGGKIFYVSMSRAEGSRYFEMACAGWSDGICGGSDLSDPLAIWGCKNSSISTGVAIGTGETNTTAIVTGCSTSNIAARKASLLVLGGYDDWFLPSKLELNQICVNRGVLGLTTSFDLLSSSQQSSTHAHAQYSSGPCGSYTAAKDSTTRVRPVRSF